MQISKKLYTTIIITILTLSTIMAAIPMASAEIVTAPVLYAEGTTTVINATKVWNSDVLNAYGAHLGRIDGSGVTAVVLDSGIDAGHPDLDYKTKTIMNLKSDNGNPPWIEVENSDTSSGHGTHCAGTVAGNGDASGGARKCSQSGAARADGKCRRK